jgi:hypothetical protein
MEKSARKSCQWQAAKAPSDREVVIVVVVVCCPRDAECRHHAGPSPAPARESKSAGEKKLGNGRDPGYKKLS